MIHIHAPEGSHTLQKNLCVNCKDDEWMLGTHFEWYSSHWTCLKCGERYNDDGIAPRPFERGWRNKSRNSAMQIIKNCLDIQHVEWIKKARLAPKNKSR